MVDLVFEGLGKRFGSAAAVTDLSVKVRAGAVTAFLGPNGAGKTTTLRMALGLVRPTAGAVTFDGVAYRGLRSPRRVVGALLGPDGFHPGRSGRDHLRVVARSARIGDSRVEEVLGLVGLQDAAGRRVSGYSLGMRQRLGLATALLADPAMVIADEPANGLDPEGIAWLRSLLRSLAAEGRTVLVSSHLLAEVSRTADRVAVIHAGRLRFDGTVAELAGSDSAAPEALEAAFLRLTGGEVAA